MAADRDVWEHAPVSLSVSRRGRGVLAVRAEEGEPES